MAPELRRKVAWLIAVRVVVSTLLLGSATIARIATPSPLAIDPFFLLAGLTYALTIASALSLSLVERRRWIVDLQLTADALIVTAFIYLTGGITSYFSSLYVLPIVAASNVRLRRGGVLIATVSAALYAALVAGHVAPASASGRTGQAAQLRQAGCMICGSAHERNITTVTLFSHGPKESVSLRRWQA